MLLLPTMCLGLLLAQWLLVILSFSTNKFTRWRECVTDTDNVLGFALGAMFINSTFNTQSKPEAESMITVKIFFLIFRTKKYVQLNFSNTYKIRKFTDS